MYCTLEQVKQAINVTAPSTVDDQIIRQIQSASLVIDGDMQRPPACFWPVTDTRYFDWMDHQYSLTWRLWLNGNDLAAAPTKVLSGGVDITSGVIARNGVDDVTPPFSYLETDLNGDTSFMAVSSYQRAIAVSGLYLACPPSEAPAGVLSAVNSTATTAFLSNSNAVGVGHVIRVDTERMIVTGKTFADSGLTLHADLAATSASQLVSINSNSVSAGEVIMVDAEQLLVTGVVGLNVVVKRAWNGSALASHTTGTELYVNRTATLVRGALGTTAASHLINAPIFVHQVPTPVQTLALAETLRLLGLERAGYASVIERGSMTKIDNAEPLWKQVRTPYQRKLRISTPGRFI
jgi:hypothetical protein